MQIRSACIGRHIRDAPRHTFLAIIFDARIFASTQQHRNRQLMQQIIQLQNSRGTTQELPLNRRQERFLPYLVWALLLRSGDPRCRKATAAKGIILKNAIYIASAMVWISVVAAHLIRVEMPQASAAVIPIHVMAPGAVTNATAVAPWERRCGKVYIQKMEGQPDQKFYRPCLIV